MLQAGILNLAVDKRQIQEPAELGWLPQVGYTAD